jgi:hypothetical protein
MLPAVITATAGEKSATIPATIAGAVTTDTRNDATSAYAVARRCGSSTSRSRASASTPAAAAPSRLRRPRTAPAPRRRAALGRDHEQDERRQVPAGDRAQTRVCPIRSIVRPCGSRRTRWRG